MSETQVTETEKTEVVSEQRKNTRGSFVGKAKTSDLMKRWWREETSMPGKRERLRSFAKRKAKEGNELAQEWLAHKKGSLNQKRSDKNASDAKLIAAATKQARRGKKK